MKETVVFSTTCKTFSCYSKNDILIMHASSIYLRLVFTSDGVGVVVGVIRKLMT